MSSIDERVVQMQFQNSQFEKGVKESIKSLEHLKESLKLEEAANGLKRLQEAGDSFSLAKVSEGVDALSDRFSVFGTFAARIIENLADTVYTKLGGALKEVTIGQVSAGWQKYAEDTSAVQTIWFSTKDYDASIKSIKDVEAELDKLMWFTDETSYNYTDMVGNIGKFTAMKIPLQEARVAMQGIALAAAAAGQGAPEASRAMYNLSQAMGMGALKLQDWNSLVNANIVTSGLSEKFIEAGKALGTLNKNGEVYISKGKKMKVTAENIRDTLTAGWITKDVMMKVFGDYGSFAEKVKEFQDQWAEDHNGEYIETSEVIKMLSGTTEQFAEDAFRAGQEAKTFAEAIGSLSDAASTKWLKIFKLIFGNYEEVKELWTGLANNLYTVFVEPLNTLIDEHLSIWHDLDEDGGWKDFMQGVFDIMDGLTGLLVTVRDAFSNFIPPITIETLKSFSLAVKDFGASFKAAFGIPEEEGEEVTKEVEKVGTAVEKTAKKTEKYEASVKKVSKVLDNSFKMGDRGEEVKKFQEQLNTLGFDAGAVDGIYGPKTEAAFKKYEESLKKADKGVKDLTDSNKALEKYSDQSQPKLEDSEEIEATGEAAKEATGYLVEFKEELKRGSKGEEVKKMQEMLIALGYDLDRFGADGIFGPETQAALKEFERDAGFAVDGVYDAAEAQSLTEAFNLGEVKKGFEELSEALQIGSKNEEVKTLQKRLKEMGMYKGPLDGIYGPKTKAAVEQFEKDMGIAIDGIYDAEDHAAMREKLGFNVIVEEAEEAREKTEEAAEETVKYSSRLEQLKSISGGIFAAGGILLKIAGMVGNVLVKIIKLAAPLGEAFLTIAAAVGDALIAFNNWLGEEGRFDSFFKTIESALKPVGEWIAKVSDSILIFFELKKPISDTNKEVVTFRKLWKSVVDYVKNSAAFSAMSSAFESLKKAFSDLVGVFKNSKFDGKGIGNVLLKGLEYIGKGLTWLLVPISWVIKGFSSFISFLVENVPIGIEKIKSFWSSLDNSINAKGIIGFLAKVKKALISVKEFWFGGTDEKGNKKDGIFAKIGKAISGDATEFANGISGGFMKTISDIIGFVRPLMNKIGAGIVRLFTGNGGLDILSSKTIKNIDRFRDGIKNVLSHIRLLFMGNYLNRRDLSDLEKTILRFRGSIISVIGNIRSTVLNIWSAIKKFISSINFGSWDEFKKSLSAVWGNIKNSIVGFFENLGSGFSNAIKRIKESGSFIFIWGLAIFSIIAIISRVWKIIKTLHETISNFSEFMKNITQKKEQKLSEKILQFAASVALIAGSIYVLSLLDPATFWKAFARMAAILAVLGGFVLLAGKFGKKDNVYEAIAAISDSILKISESLLILSGVVVGLGFIDPSKFWKGFGFMASIMGAILAFSALTALISKISPNNYDGDGLKGVAVSILILTSVIKLLAMMKFEIFIKGLTKLIAIMGLILAFTLVYRLIDKIPTNPARTSALLGVTGAILALTAITALLGVMPFSMFIKGFTKLILIMGLVLTFTLIYRAIDAIPTHAARTSALLGITGVIFALTLIVGLLGVLPLFTLIKGIAALTVVMTLLTVFMLVTSKVGQIGFKKTSAVIPILLAMVAMVGTFIVLTHYIKKLGGVALAGAIVSLIAIIIALRSVSKTISGFEASWKSMVGFFAGIGGLIGSIIAFVYLAKELQNVSIGSIAGALISVVVLVLAIKSIFKAMSESEIEWKSMLAFLASAIVLSGAMIAFGYAMSLMKDIDPKQILSFSTALAEIMIAFSIVGAIAGAVNPGMSFLGILAVAAAMVIVIGALAAILKIKGIDEFLSSGAEKIGKIIGSFIGAMKAAEIESFNEAVKELESIEPIDQSKVDNAVKAAQSIADFGAGLPAKGLLEQAADRLFGSELSQFSTGMTDFGVGFNSFANSISGVAEFSGLDTKTKNAIDIAEQIKAFGDSLSAKPIDKTIVDAIFGSELSQFSGDMTDFGEGLNNYATSISKVTSNTEELFTKTSAAIAVASSIKRFGDSLNSKSIDQTIVDAICGSELSQFSGDMVSFGEGLNNYAIAMNKVEGIESLTEKTTTAIGIAASIKTFGDSLKNKSIDQTIVDAILKTSPMKEFSTDMVSFGEGLHNYSVAMSKVTGTESLAAKTTAAIGIATSIKTFGNSLKTKSIDQTIVDAILKTSPMKDFSADMVSFGEGFNNYAEGMKKIVNTDALAAKTTAAIGIATSIKRFGDSLKTKSIDQTIVDALMGTSPLKSFSGDMTQFADSFNTYSRTMRIIKVNDLTEINEKTNIAIGIANAINSFGKRLKSRSFDEALSDSLFGSKLGNFSGDMTKFANSFNKYAVTMNGIYVNKEKVESQTELAIGIAEQIASFLDSLGSMDIETKKTGLNGWFNGSETKGDTVITSISRLAESMKQSETSFAGLSSGTLVADVESGIEALKAFALFLTILSSDAIDTKAAAQGSSSSMDMYSVGSKLDDFLSGLTSLSTKIVEFSQNTSGIDISAIAAVIHAVSEFMNLMASLYSGQILEEVGDFEFGDELSENITKIATALGDSQGAFKDAGINIDLGLAEGIREQSQDPVDAAGSVAQLMLNKIAEVLDEHSPSEETFEQGVNVVLGLVNGVLSKKGEAEDASSILGDSVLNPLKERFLSEDNPLTSLLSGEDFSWESVFPEGEFSLDSILPDGKISLESLFDEDFDTDQVFGNVQTWLDDLNVNKAESKIKGLFDTVTSSGDELKANYSIETLLFGDLKRGDRSESVRKMQEQLMSLGYNLDKFGADGIFGPETQAAVNKFKQDVGLAADGVFDSNAYTKLVEVLSSTQAKTAYTEAGNDIAQTVSEGVSSGDTSKAEEVISSILEKFGIHDKDFKITGENFSMGLTSGVYAKTHYAIQAAEFTARQMVIAIRNIFQTASPSKVTAEIGGYFAQGLAKGVEKDGDQAVDSTEGLAEAMLSTASGTIKSLSDLLLEGIDAEPTITPVIDITKAQEAAGSIRDLFQNPSSDMSMTRKLVTKATVDADGKEIESKAQIEADSIKSMVKSLEDMKLAGDKDRSGDILEHMDGLSDKLGSFAEAALHMKIVLDSGVLVGSTASAYNKQLGILSAMSERGN